MKFAPPPDKKQAPRGACRAGSETVAYADFLGAAFFAAVFLAGAFFAGARGAAGLLVAVPFTAEFDFGECGRTLPWLPR